MTSETVDQKLSPQGKVVHMLMNALERAKAGKLQAVIVGYITTEGAAAVESTPMSPVMLNHVSYLLQRRVSNAYDRAAAAQVPNSGVGAVPATGGKDKIVPVTPGVPIARKQRRLMAKQINKLAKKATGKSASPANGNVPAALKPQ